MGDHGPGRVDPPPTPKKGVTGAANPMTAPNTTPQIPSRDDPGTTMPGLRTTLHPGGVRPQIGSGRAALGGMSGDTKLARV